MTPEISVQVPVKNGGDRLRRFLKSLAVQDIQSPWELVIADDGSDVPVKEEFLRELNKLPELCSLKVLRIFPGGVRPAARNQALETSEASVALLMDADLEFAPSLLRRHLEVREKTGADVIMGRRINAWSKDATPWQKWFDSRAMGNAPAGKFPWNYFITGNLSVTCALLKDAGGFDTAISSYGGEDTELGYRLDQAQVSFQWEPELSVNHLDDVSVRQHSEKMLEYGATGLKYTLASHPDIKGLLGSRWIEPVFSRPVHLCFMRMFTRAALAGSVYRAVLKYAEKHGRPSVLFTYLAVGATLIGLRGGDYHK
ncbi:MAG: glycosyltransferase family 2 protein [Candidatus Sabulitectum sp.]|nr:glycosyltransferase family 2 protein [Candidatus Sabulitectum sp.]